MPKKKKIKKQKSSNSKRSLSKFDLQLEKDGKEYWKNFNPKPVKVNVYDKARSIKTWDQLRHILEAYAPAVAYPSSAAQIILNHVREKWNFYKIFKDPDNYGAIVKLVNFVSRVGAPRALKSQHLKVFCKWTGFRKPTNVDTFFNDMTKFRIFLGVKRDKSGKYSKERSAKESIRRMKKLSKPSKSKPINYKDYEQTALGWRKKIK